MGINDKRDHLIYRFKEYGDQQAFNDLLTTFSSIKELCVKRYLSKLSPIIDEDDIIQMMSLNLLEMIRDDDVYQKVDIISTKLLTYMNRKLSAIIDNQNKEKVAEIHYISDIMDSMRTFDSIDEFLVIKNENDVFINLFTDEDPYCISHKDVTLLFEYFGISSNPKRVADLSKEYGITNQRIYHRINRTILRLRMPQNINRMMNYLF